MVSTDPLPLLQACYDAAVKAAQAEQCLPPYLPPYPEQGRLIVIGAGKAAAAMAQVVERHYAADPRLREESIKGLVITRYGYEKPCKHIKVLSAAHPVPDENGVKATQAMLDFLAAQNLTAEDTVLFLVSGGGSALMPLPLPGLSLAQKQEANKALIKCGADIHEINCVRKHLSGIKGGRLAAHCAPANVKTLIISDVDGDDISTIASGPTAPDDTTQEQALSILEKYDLLNDLDFVKPALTNPEFESPKPGNTVFERVQHTIIAGNEHALEALKTLCEENGFEPVLMPEPASWNARKLAKAHVQMVHKKLGHNKSIVSQPLALISGGEATAVVTGNGDGGPNQEYVLQALITADGHPAIWGMAGDTDGVDGNKDIGGAWFGPDTLAQARAKGLDPQACLDNNDAGSFFAALEPDQRLIPGPTFTNVNDVRVLLVAP